MAIKAKRFRVVLLRANGRFVKETRPMSKYAAKKQQEAWDAKYDAAYYTEIRIGQSFGNPSATA